MEKTLTKKDLADLLADRNGLTKAQAADVLGTLLDAWTDILKEGGSVDLYGFGKFTVAERAARSGFNPATKEKIEIPASRAVKFKPAKALKDVLAQS